MKISANPSVEKPHILHFFKIVKMTYALKSYKFWKPVIITNSKHTEKNALRIDKSL